MSGPAAIMGQLVDAKNIAVHKTLRLSIDVPVEHAQLVLNAFGWPTMANPVPVAIARLVDGAEAQQAVTEIEESPVEPVKAKGGKFCQRAAILCNEGGFRTFLAERDTELAAQVKTLDKAMAATELRSICGVQSRSELDGNVIAMAKFKDLEREYKAWMISA